MFMLFLNCHNHNKVSMNIVSDKCITDFSLSYREEFSMNEPFYNFLHNHWSCC